MKQLTSAEKKSLHQEFPNIMSFISQLKEAVKIDSFTLYIQEVQSLKGIFFLEKVIIEHNAIVGRNIWEYFFTKAGSHIEEEWVDIFYKLLQEIREVTGKKIVKRTVSVPEHIEEKLSSAKENFEVVSLCRKK